MPRPPAAKSSRPPDCPSPADAPAADGATRLGVVLLGFLLFLVLAGLVRRGVISVMAGVFVLAAAAALLDVVLSLTRRGRKGPDGR